MAAPPPDGFSPGHPKLPAAADAPGQTWGMAFGGDAEARSPAAGWTAVNRTALTPWLWFPVALSSMLLVLFVVVVNRQQAQAQRIGELLSRVQALEHSRALERTAVLEQQLRSMLNRLQELEKQNKQQEQLARQLQMLQQELQQLRSAASRPISPLPDLPSEPELPAKGLGMTVPRTPASP